MVFASLSLTALFGLIAWRLVFKGLRRGSLARGIVAPQQQHNNILDQGLHVLDPARVTVIPDNRFEDASDDVRLIIPKDRAKTYLFRIVALTGATRMGNRYVLDVGTTRFHVRDRYVGRTRDVTDPDYAYEETCFYSAHKEIPKSEHIATALLHLKNNPALFDQWAAQRGAFKADGQAFNPCAAIDLQ
jgi:hypothetical protein